MLFEDDICLSIHYESQICSTETLLICYFPWANVTAHLFKYLQMYVNEQQKKVKLKPNRTHVFKERQGFILLCCHMSNNAVQKMWYVQTVLLIFADWKGTVPFSTVQNQVILIKRSQETEEKCQAHRLTYSEYNQACFRKTTSTLWRGEIWLYSLCFGNTVSADKTLRQSCPSENECLWWVWVS